MNQIKVKYILFSLFLFMSAANAEDWSKVRKAIEKANEQIAQAMINQDLNTVSSFYTKDAVSLPNYSHELRGLDNIIADSKKDFADGLKYYSGGFKTTDLYGTGDLAVEIGEWSVTYSIHKSTEKRNGHGKYLVVWQKQSDSSWRIKTETWNANEYPGRSNSSKDEVTKVKETVDGIAKSIENEDIHIFENITAHDSDMVSFGTDSDERWVGYDNFLGSVKKQFNSFENTRLKVKDQVIKIHDSGNVAWFSELADWSTKAGGQKTEIKDSRITGVLEKRDDKWVLVQFHASVPVEGQAAQY